MRIPERDMTYILLPVYLLALISPIGHKMDHTQVNLTHVETSELEFDFAKYTDVRIACLC